EEFAYWLAFEPVTQRTQLGIEGCKDPAAVADRELVLALLDASDERVDVERVGSERPGRKLAVEDGCSDVVIVCRALAPAHGTRVGGQPHEAHEFAGKRLDAGDSHQAAPARAAGDTRATSSP